MSCKSYKETFSTPSIYFLLGYLRAKGINGINTHPFKVYAVAANNERYALPLHGLCINSLCQEVWYIAHITLVRAIT